MVIISLPDIHGDVHFLSRIAGELDKADLVVLPGDLTTFGRRHVAAEVLQAVRKHCPMVYAVSGNCDYPDVDDYLTEEDVNLHGNKRSFGGITFYGLGGSLPCPNRTANEFTEAELKGALASAAAGMTSETRSVLVSHEPPYGTATDLTTDGAHAGSRAVRAFIEEYQPLVCFTGHIHEARAIDSIGQTKVVNPGPLRGGGYAYAVLSTELELLEIRR